jgi:hypothetical protein
MNMNIMRFEADQALNLALFKAYFTAFFSLQLVI